MGLDIVNRIKNSEIHGDLVGHDKIDVDINLYLDNEREYVVTRNANITPVSYFTGRETELRELSQMIESGRKLVLVSGMGGIGKTHICRKLFKKYLDKPTYRFRHIGYIEYNGNMDSSLQNCLKFKEQDNPKHNQEAAWRELEYLASDGKLLLFIDNVDKSIGEDKSLQRLTSIPGAIILTSRQVSLGDEFELYPIGFLDMEQCKEIYQKIRFSGSGKKIKPEEIQDLEYVIEDLAGRHTITVEFLAHLARTKHWPVKRLREELEQKSFRLEFHKNGELVNIQKSYEVLYDLSRLTEAEQNILEAFSVFPYIPLAAETCNEWLLADAGVSEEDDILVGLYRKGWLQFDIKQESYTMHPVFALFVYDKCNPNIEKHIGLIRSCKDSMEIPDDGMALECQKFIPFGGNIVEKVDMGKESQQIYFINTYAELLRYLGQYKEAVKLYRILLEICRERLGENHPDTVAVYNNLAVVYESQGEYEKAEELFEKNIRIRERAFEKDYESLATAYNNLAGVYSVQGEYEKAEELYEKSMMICERELGREHEYTISSYNNLGTVYYHQGEYEKAEELYEKSIRIRERMLGGESPSMAISYGNLAAVYDNQGEYKKAEELYEKSIRIRERVLGEEHPNTAISYNNLAVVYEKQGEHKKAEELLKKSIRVRERVLGEEHPDTVDSYNNLAYVYESQGEHEKAISYFLKVYKFLYYKFGFEHSETEIILRNMIIIFSKCYPQSCPESDFVQWLKERMKEE